MRLSKAALLMLAKHYRSILKHALLASLLTSSLTMAAELEIGGSLTWEQIKQSGVDTTSGAFANTVLKDLSQEQAEENDFTGNFAAIKTDETQLSIYKDLTLSNAQYNNGFFISNDDKTPASIRINNGTLTLENGGTIGEIIGTNLSIKNGDFITDSIVINELQLGKDSTINCDGLSAILISGQGIINTTRLGSNAYDYFINLDQGVIINSVALDGDTRSINGYGTININVNNYYNYDGLGIKKSTLNIKHSATFSSLGLSDNARFSSASLEVENLTIGSNQKAMNASSDISIANTKVLKAMGFYATINVYSGMFVLNPKDRDINLYVEDLKKNNATAALVLADNTYSFTKDDKINIKIGTQADALNDESIIAGANSLTILDNAKLTNTKLTVDDKAKLMVKNVKDGEIFISNLTINGSTDLSSLKGWSGDNIIFANKFFDAKYDKDSNSYIAFANFSKDVYSKLSDNQRSYIFEISQNTSDLNHNGDIFVNQILNDVAAEDTEAIVAQKRINSLSNIAYLSGIYSIASTIADNQDKAISSLDKKSSGVFAMPLYTNSNYNDLNLSNFSYGLDLDLTGMAIGLNKALDHGSFAIYSTFGKGKSSSDGDSVATTNNYDFYSLGASVSKSFNNLEVFTNFAYSVISSDVEQSNLDKLNASFDSNLLFLQLGAQYNYALADNISINPYIKAQMKYIDVDGFDVTNQAKIMSVGSNNASLFEVPIGAKLEYTHVSGDFTIVPSLDMAIIPGFGDNYVDTTIIYNSSLANSAMSVNSDISSAFKYKVAAAIDGYYHNNQFAIGVDYIGSNVQSDIGVSAKYQYNF